MPLGLVLLSVIPVVAGSIRLVGLAGPARVGPGEGGYLVPLVVHVVSSVLFALVGALQFAAPLRRRGRRWHRNAGRLVAPAGLVAAGSAPWLTFFSLGWGAGGGLLYAFRILFGSAMAASLALGFVAIRRGDVGAHRAWMTRGYAIGLGAGTQAFTLGFGQAIVGVSELSTALLMGAGWALNLLVAQWAISGRSAGCRA